VSASHVPTSACGHDHTPHDFGVAFAVGVGLNTAYVLSQVIFGIRANSVALLADAGHNFGDVLGLLAAWTASALVKRPPTERRTYGLGSTSILASLFNAVILLVSVGGIGWEALQRLIQPAEVQSHLIIAVAAAGIFVNGITAILFLRGKDHDLNLQGAFSHMAADALISAGVVVAGIAIMLTGWKWVDSVVSLLIAATVISGTWNLLRKSMNLAMMGVPDGVDVPEVKQFLESLPGVEEAHDLHIWALSTTDTALTAHLVMPAAGATDEFLHDLSFDLHRKFHIDHPTIQIESGELAHACHLAPDNVV
jgi:cobalt-zinc-cadmium efflux system protein